MHTHVIPDAAVLGKLRVPVCWLTCARLMAAKRLLLHLVIAAFSQGKL